MKDKIAKRIERTKVIATVDGIYGETCVKLAKALLNGGVELLELALNGDKNPQVWSTVQLLHSELGESMLIGIGNVSSIGDVVSAREANAAFVSSFTTDKEVICTANACGLVTIPGALTPSEIAFAHLCGADFVKVYPAGSMGPAYFNHIHRTIGDISILACGGITRSNVRLYKHAGVIGVFAEDCLFSQELVDHEEWGAISEMARMFVRTI